MNLLFRLLSRPWYWCGCVCIAISSLALSGCSSELSYAPVEDILKRPRVAHDHRYRVRSGDTLYSIAFAFGFDYRELAKINQLPPPYLLHPGQTLLVLRVKPSLRVKHKPRSNPTKPANLVHHYRQSGVQKRVHSTLPKHPPKHWRWPIRGRILRGFTGSYGTSQGIDIRGYLGQPIHASAAGVVVYSGHGVRGYGNLVIIMHSKDYLTAYAYARKRLVAVGQRVRAGQVIAEVGRGRAGRTRLHFEIRRKGRPVSPLRYLHR